MYRLYKISTYRDEFIGFFPSYQSAKRTAKNYALGTDDDYYVVPNKDYGDLDSED